VAARVADLRQRIVLGEDRYTRPPAAPNARAKGSRQVAHAALDLHTACSTVSCEPRGGLLLLEAQLGFAWIFRASCEARPPAHWIGANDRLRCRHAGSVPLSTPRDHPAFAARSDTVTSSG
jgi:hypothetical protein